MPSALPAKLALTILGRLEAATSRLEDLVPTIADPSLNTDGSQSLRDQALSGDRALDQAGTHPRHMEALPPVIDDFDAIINEQVKSFVNMSEEIGGLVAEQVLPLAFYHSSETCLADHRITSLLLSFGLLVRNASFSLSQPRLGSQTFSPQPIWRF